MKHSLLLLVFSITLLCSCNKNKNDQPQPPNPPGSTTRVKTASSASGYYTYTYDAQGRLTSSLYSDNSKVDFAYSQNAIAVTAYNPDGSLDYTGTRELNAAGLVTKQTYSNSPGSTYLIEYNADKTVAKTISNSGGDVIVQDYLYTNGSLDSIRYTKNSEWQYTSRYSYFTDKPDLLSNEVFGEMYDGSTGKYLVKSELTKFNDGGENTWNYTYEFDAQGRVTKRSAQKDQSIQVRLYTYY